MGIPNQVQKELALHRTSTFQQLVSTQPRDQDGRIRHSQSGVVIIPTVDGGTPVANKEGARVHLSDLETASRDEQLLTKHLQAMNQEEQAFSHQSFGSYLGSNSNLRPKSLAVPGMTTSFTFSSSTMLSFLQEPQGPVMSISPQATYLSTIIPNAVLPASIDVIEIDRSSSRTRGISVNHGGSVRTVSKSSLASGDSSVSPLLSRRSDGDGSQADTFHRESTPIPTSASGPTWSELQGSKISSQSSPVSSKGSTHSANSQKVELKGQESQGGHASGDHDHISLRSSVSMSSSQSENVFTGQGRESVMSGSAREDGKTKQNFSRSLSVMKTKQPPAPPRRTNSLHSNRIRSNSRALVESRVLNESVSGVIANETESPAAKNDAHSVVVDTSKIPIPVSNSADCVSSSPVSPAQVSTTEAGRATESQSECANLSPQKSTSNGVKFERTMSPSSGYSSQSGTPTLSPKGVSPTSPEKQKKKPIKPDRSVSRASSSGASPSSSLTSLSSGASESVHVPTCSPSPPPQGSSPTVAAKDLPPENTSPTLTSQVRELLNIPPPPKVRAPCPPPPETWVHNSRSFELLCSPCSNVSNRIQKPTEMSDSTVKQAGTQTEESNDIEALAVKQLTVGSLSVTDSLESAAEPEALSETAPGVVCKESESSKCPEEDMSHEEGKDTQKLEQRSSPVLTFPESQETTPKKDPPPVMKKPVTVLHREEVASKEPSVDTKLNQISGTEADVPGENITILSLDSDKCENKISSIEVTSLPTLSVEIPKINKTSPPPSPPPAYHPTPPLSRRTPTPSISMLPEDLERVPEENPVIESCWPPPPPPMEGDSVFDGGDEVDFPPPPPLFVPESGPKVMDSCMTALDLSKRSTDGGEERVEESLVCQQTPDVPPAVQTVTDTKPKVDVHIYQDNVNEEHGQKTVSVSDNKQPLLEDAPVLQAVTKAEHQVSVSAPSSSILNQSSVTVEDQSPPAPPVSAQPPVTAPAAPPLPAESLAHGVSFRRQPSVATRDPRSKELLSRHKSAPIPKEDANIPLVTPSLLQMVRLRSVNMTEDQVKAPSEDKPTNLGAPAPENNSVLNPGPQNIPQKPIRKSLSLKSPPKTVKVSPLTLNTPSLRLQEAIRMKTAAMSSRDSLPSRLGVWSSAHSYVSEHGAVPQKPPEGGDTHKSPASTASFIFSRSTKKVVIETAAASCPEAQVCLKQSLAAELMQMSDQSKAVTFSNGGVKSDKIPPPVAKKPAHGGSISTTPTLPACSAKMDYSVGGNGAIGVRHVSGITQLETTTTRVTADTIETLF